jgi:hypothetical protein
LILFFPCVPFADDDALLASSREIVARFTLQLQAALQDAMATGGPTNAIGVCKDSAPDIAANLSRESGAQVSRTSLKLRNPANAPQDWQMAVLKDFELPAASPEYFEQSGKNGFRYMKTIVTGPLCLTCHGTDLSESIQAELDQAYPNDRARGYRVGDVRGAFSIVWPDGV